MKPNQAFLPTHIPSNQANGNGHKPLPGNVPIVDDDDFDLQQLLTVLRRRLLTFASVTLVSAGGLIAWQMTRPPSFRGSFDLLVEPVTVVNELDIDSSLLNGEEQTGLDYTSQIRVLRSPTVLEPIVETIQERYPDISYSTLLGRLSITREGESKILRVSYSDTDPEAAEYVMARVSEGFINYSIENRQGDLQRGLTFVDEQLEEKWQEVDTLEAELSAFQKRNDLVNVDEVSNSVTQRLNQTLAEQETLWVELASLESLYANLESQVGFRPDVAIQVSNLSESPNYQQLLEELRLVEQEIAQELTRFQRDTPMIQALEDRRQQLIPLLQAEARRVLGSTPLDPTGIGHQGQISQTLMQQLVETTNQIQVLNTREQAIAYVAESLQAEIQRLADLSRSYQQIERELSAAESSLNQLLASRQELRFQIAQQTSPWELVSPLDESSIVRASNLPRKLVLSSLVSLLLGAGAALLRDKLDQVFHSPEEAMEATRLPALAAVPHAPSLQQRALMMESRMVSTMEDVMDQKRSLGSQERNYSFAFAEAFYGLETNLRLLSSDTPVQVVTITSSLPGEGKSTTSAHLAIAAANMGRRVLVVDVDLRQPSLHDIFGLPNRVGLSDLITQGVEKAPQVIRSLDHNPNLHFLGAGTQPPAPGRLLSSQRMHQLIEACRQRYDLIILDTPPLIGIADAKLVAAQADGLLLVARLRKTPRSEVQRVLADLNNTAQAPILGLVINGVLASSRHGYYSQYYGHYHRPAHNRG